MTVPAPNIPNPDPSLIANERLEEAKNAIRREMLSIREESKGWIESLQVLLEQKIINVSNKTIYIEENINTLRQYIDRHTDIAVANLKELLSEKTDSMFDKIKTQFNDRDVRTEQTANQVKLAVDAALQAQKEAASEQAKSFSAATTKSETAMNRQIEGLDGKISDVKDRMNRVEATGLGAASNRSDNQQEDSLRLRGSQNMISIASAIISLLAVMIAIGGMAYTLTRPGAAVVYESPRNPV